MDHPLDFCTLIKLPRFTDQRGTLTALESTREVPFGIERVFYIYDVPAGATRSGHANRWVKELIVAVSGSFSLIVRDPTRTKRFELLRGFEAVYVPPLLWVDIEDFSTGSVALVLADAPFDASDHLGTAAEYRSAYFEQFGPPPEL
jgi:dTDP-4-dehydrorhamnose 3,5-epimerase-like enzyme